MSPVLSPPQPRRLPAAIRTRLGLLALLAIVEAVALTSHFDTGNLRGDSRAWVELLRGSRVAFPLGLAVVTAFVLFAGQRAATLAEVLVPDGPRTDTAAAGRRRGRAWPWAAVHALAVLGFVGATHVLFEREDRSNELGWLALWCASGAASVGSLALWALPLQTLGRLLHRSAGLMVLGVVVGVAAWSAGQSTDAHLWELLGRPTLTATAACLTLVGAAPVVDATTFVIGTGDFHVQIGVGCSGYEGIGLIWVFLSVYLGACRHELRFPRALWLLPLGTAAVWCTNVVRIVVLILVGAHLSPDVAEGAFHARMGWILFCGVALGLVAITWRTGLFRRTDPRETGITAGRPLDPTPAYLLPLVVVLGTGLLTRAVTSGWDAWYPCTVVAGALALRGSRERLLAIDWRPTRASLLAVTVGLVVFAGWLPLVSDAGTSLDPSLRDALARPWSAGTVLWIVVRVVGAVLLVPLVEELAFRGYLARRLIAADFERVPIGALTLVSFLGSSLLFGLAHQHWVAGTLAGMAYALAAAYRARLSDAIVAHAVTNACIVAWVFAIETQA